MVEAGEVVVEVQEYMAEAVAVAVELELMGLELELVVAERHESNSRTVFLDNNNCTVYVCVYRLIALLR